MHVTFLVDIIFQFLKILGGSVKIYIVYLYMCGVYVYRFGIILNM